MCVEFLDPQPGERVIDPACGSGGFLVETVAHLSKNGESSVGRLSQYIFGIDKEIDLAKEVIHP